MRPAIRTTLSRYRRIHYSPYKWYSSQPPTARPHKQLSAEERVSRQPDNAKELDSESKSNKSPALFSRLFRRKKQPGGIDQYEPPDPARGIEASKRFVREGVIDPKYRSAGRRVTALICALPIAIYLGWELFRRRFGEVEQKRFPKVKSQQDLR